MPYRITGLAPSAVDTANAIPHIVDATPGYPCRITLEDAPIGETVLLVNHEHLAGPTPYRASHAIFIRRGAMHPASFVDEIPPMLARRLLSVRAYDDAGMMRDADVVDGTNLAPLIEAFLRDRETAFLHVHTAKRGCYLARVDRIAG